MIVHAGCIRGLLLSEGCRHSLQRAGARTRRPFALPGAPRRYARDREVDLEHVVLELDVDFESKRLRGRATHHLRPLRPGLERFGLDAVEMDIEEVLLDGKPVKHAYDGRRLVVQSKKALPEGRTAKLSVGYSCTPRRGFYFIEPDDDAPHRTVHAWSQGQDEDSRYWWPVHDYPNEKATTEMIATVPAEFFALSNGELTETKKKKGRKTYHWKMGTAHVPYLVTLAVGPFEKLKQKAGDVPCTTYFLPGNREEAERCVADTPRMLELFGKLTGVPYPYEKYDQVFVEDFLFGGMENTTATTLTDLVLHDERAAIDYTAEDLISHELAHQWWGNLVTCRDWSHAWLNEGFATWSEVVWKEHARGEDEAWMLRRELYEGYFAEDSESYRRPIVCRSYAEPIELFDAHLYMKGACVVSMLRDELGDVLFWRALQGYLKEHHAGNVETDDLRRAIERASGRNFEKFFEQWVESAGHPELRVDGSWDASHREYVVEVSQLQEGDDTPAIFEVSVPLALRVAGEWKEETLELTQRKQAFAFALPSRPDAMAFDHRDRVLKTVEWDRALEPLVVVLESAPWAPARADAATALGKDGSLRAVGALAKALQSDAFWGVQAAAAAALGTVRSAAARDALLDSVSVEHPKARRAVFRALGSLRDAKAFEACKRVVEKGDASYQVEAEAAASMGRTRQPGALAALAKALRRKAKSWNELVRCGVIDGLGSLGQEERDEAIDLLFPWTASDKHPRCRRAAARALARLGTGHRRVRERLEELLEDREFMVVLYSAEALGELGDPKSRGALGRLAETSLDGRIARAARDSLRRLGEDSGVLARLSAQCERLEADNQHLRERLDRLESRQRS